MKWRDWIFLVLIISLSLWCLLLRAERNRLSDEFQAWETNRFELTRVLMDLKKRIFMLEGNTEALNFIETDIYKLNFLSPGPYSFAFLKFAQRLEYVAMYLEANRDRGVLENKANRPKLKTVGVNFPDIWPTKGRITSLFGLRMHPILKAPRFHSGVDIANLKDTEVLVAANGTVKFSGPERGYGNMVVVDHGNGFESRYGHAQELLVSAGETVKKGQLIASMGSTGLSTGDHLHYEIRFAGEALDPTVFVK